MGMSEEKIYILKMLEDGKITSEDAARLLEAVDPGKNKDESFGKGKKNNFTDEISKVKDRLNDWTKDFKNNYSQKDFDKAVEEFSTKMEKVGKNLAYTTIGIADKVVDFVSSFVDTNSFNVFGKFKATDKTFEIDSVSEDMDLSVEGINGHILVKKHMENKIIIRSLIRSPQDNAEQILDFVNDGKVVSLKYNKIGNISVSHEIFLPVIKLNSIKLSTKNGKIYVEDSLSKEFEAVTSNNNIDLMGVNSDTINVSTKNARVQFGYITGKNINVETDNSVIDIKHVKAESISAATRNGRILVENIHNYPEKSNIDIILKTLNAGIKVNMNDMDKKGYKIKAHTTNGEINLLIPEILYHNTSKQMNNYFVEAESNNFEAYESKVNISAQTSNGYIEVVK